VRRWLPWLVLGGLLLLSRPMATTSTKPKGRRATKAQHSRARELATVAFAQVYGHAPSLGERQYLQAVACLETTYGAGWRGDGKGSNNMGAIQAGRPPCNPATSFETRDTHADGTVYRWCYKRYATPLDGWIDLVRVLFKKREGVRALAARADFMAAVAEQRRTKYFEAPLERYQKAVFSCLREMSEALGEPLATGTETPRV